MQTGGRATGDTSLTCRHRLQLLEGNRPQRMKRAGRRLAAGGQAEGSRLDSYPLCGEQGAAWSRIFTFQTETLHRSE